MSKRVTLNSINAWMSSPLDFKYVGQILGEIIRVTEQEIDDVDLYWELMPNFFKHLDYEAPIATPVPVNTWTDSLSAKEIRQVLRWW